METGPSHDRVILVVDDDPQIRANTAELLCLSGHPAIPLASGEEALAWCAAHPGRAILAVIDLSMPGIGGSQTFHRLRQLDPGLPVVVSSGSADDAAFARLRAAGITAVLRKPARAADMLATIEAALRRQAGP